jgi:hypothetical protein
VTLACAAPANSAPARPSTAIHRRIGFITHSFVAKLNQLIPEMLEERCSPGQTPSGSHHY